MEPWHLQNSDLKNYPHFDPMISREEGEACATDSERVARHAFFPLIQYDQRWTRFAPKGIKGDVKKRPIRYAARQDAYIFMRYRHLLDAPYEAELARLNLGDSVLAYRKISASDGRGGKCNIHFARDAFLKIRDLGECSAIALDISGYFESLDHSKLKNLWCRLLRVGKLPADHLQVFRAITQYSWVEKEKLYERLGHFGVKRVVDGLQIKGYLTHYRKIPKRLCTGQKFREKLLGKPGQKSIVERNYKPYGIPQGAPISDLLANLYLLEFDRTVSGWAREAGGAYYRYSDDILILVPGGEELGRSLMIRTCNLIGQFGDKLVIKEKKCALVVYQREGSDQKSRLDHGKQGRNGLEYLGFRYDGRRVFIREATISNLGRKITRAAYSAADACAKRYPDKDLTKLKRLFNYEKLLKKFGKVEEFGETSREYRTWTFWTYAVRASNEFGTLGKSILRQLRNHRKLIRSRADEALERAVLRRERRKSASNSSVLSRSSARTAS